MNKWLFTLIALSTQLHSWGTQTNLRIQQPQPENKVVIQPTKAEVHHEPPKDCRSGLVEVDYLFWKPFQEDMNFALRLKGSSNDDDTRFRLKLRPESPHFDLSSGVRLGFGGYTSDKWDVKIRGTYLHSSTQKNSHFEDALLNPSFFPTLEGSSGPEAIVHAKLTFGLVDLTLGRETSLTKKFTIHPYIGIRNVWIRETLRGFFEPELSLPSHYKYINNVWGLGPRTGMNSSYYFARNWSIQGGLSGAFVLGNYQAKQNLHSEIEGSNPIEFLHTILKDSHGIIRANLDAFLGLGWDYWFNKNKNRVYIALLCETSYWFGINQLMDFNSYQTDNGKTIVNGALINKRHGDLAFFGGTLHFQLDF